MKIEVIFIFALCAIGSLTVLFAWKMNKWKMRYQIMVEKLKFAEKSEQQLKESFQSLSLDALQKNSQSFLDLAKASLEKFQEGAKGDLEKRQTAIHELVKPVKETLGKLDVGLRELEKERKGDHASIKTQINSLLDAKKELSRETGNLVKALRTPLARGRWGEIQLRRVVEMAGMINHCDFVEQTQEVTLGGSSLRPDLIVKLPGGRQVIIDSKVPLESYMDGVQSEVDAVRQEKLKDHARLVRSHVAMLSKKAYHEHFSPTPEFVVLFLPSENFFSAALEYDPSLIEVGAEQGVIIATPTTLIALLRAVAYGWKQESLSRHAEQVSELGHELYKRIVDMASHFSKMGRALNTAVDSYNKGVGSLESRVLVSARKFKEMGAASSKIELENMEAVDKKTREITVE